ncbi:MAG TPA: hypothetical protein VGC29_05580, partial [Flavisolibacter sp.]
MNHLDIARVFSIFAHIMVLIKIIFLVGLFILFYSYVGYGMLLYFWVKTRRAFQKKKKTAVDFNPAVTLIVAAYNEEEFIEKKIANTLSLDYPPG